MCHVCPRCLAIKFAFEQRTNNCCPAKLANPQQYIPQPPPEPLLSLQTGEHPESKAYRKIAVKLNTHYAMASVSYTEIKPPGSAFNPGLRIQGSLYHKFSLNPDPSIQPQENSPVFSTIYLLDAHEEHQVRQSFVGEQLSAAVLGEICNSLALHNPYVKSYHALRDVLNDGNTGSEHHDEDVPIYTLKIKGDLVPTGAHERTYNAPTTSEVAALVPGDPEGHPGLREVWVAPRTAAQGGEHSALTKLSVASAAHMPLAYPLLRPRGEPGWSPALRGATPKISMLALYRLPMWTRVRPDWKKGMDVVAHLPSSTYVLNGRLFQRSILDAWTAIESERLTYIQCNQSSLRAGAYRNVAELLALQQRAGGDGSGAPCPPEAIGGGDMVAPGEAAQDMADMANNQSGNMTAGRSVRLPSTFLGGPRYMKGKEMDALTLMGKFGKPKFFVTMTCNPGWDDVLNNIIAGELPQDRVDLLTRVFEGKTKAYVEMCKTLFGKRIGYTIVREWQKRGLVHSHMLIWLANEDGQKYNDPRELDRVISAEIPDKTFNTELYDIVTKNMIHGPCGAINPNSPCMKNGKCSKNYPKPYASETTVDHSEDGSPAIVIHRRRHPSDGGGTFPHKLKVDWQGHRKGEIVHLGNEWVVPYNPVLLQTFGSHINCEYVASGSAIRYSFKLNQYMFKGQDRATVEISRATEQQQPPADPSNGQPQQAPTIQQVDEPKTYIDARYVCSNEAAHRILGYPIVEMFPPIQRLDLHLENGQRIVWPANTVPDLETAPASTLTAFFDLNVRDARAHVLRYEDVAHFYKYDKKSKKWAERKDTKGAQVLSMDKPASPTISRIYTISPRLGAIWYVRLLLCHVRGPKSFEDLRIVEGHLHPDYRQACIARNLLRSDAELESCIKDCELTSRASLTFLLAVILSDGIANDANSLVLKTLPTLARELCRTWPRGLQRPARRHFLSLIEDYYPYAAFKLDAALRRMTNHRDSLHSMDIDVEISPMPNAPLQLDAPELGEENNLQLDDDDDNDAAPLDGPYAHVTEEPVVDPRLQDAINNLEARVASLTEDQTVIYERVISAVERLLANVQQGKPLAAEDDETIFVVEAPGGTGKTFTFITILAKIAKLQCKALAVASTGIAGTLLPGGTTAHSGLGLPIDVAHDSLPRFADRGADDSWAARKRAQLSQICLFLWDEVFSSDKRLVECTERGFRELASGGSNVLNMAIFGGVIGIFGGCRRQCLSVQPGASRAAIVHKSLQNSYLNRKFVWLHLAENLRLRALHSDPTATDEEKNYPQYLLDLGEGRLNRPAENSVIRDQTDAPLPPGAAVYTNDTEFAQHVYPRPPEGGSLPSGLTHPAYYKQRAILVPRNDKIEPLNRIVGAMMLFGEWVRGKSINTIDESVVGHSDYQQIMLDHPPEFLATIPGGGALPASELNFKLGMPVMLLRNIDPSNGHCNGSRYIILSATPTLLMLRPIEADPTDNSRLLPLPRMKCSPGQGGGIPGFVRIQFPVRVCLAMTINKAQGQSFGAQVGVHLEQECFTHGQLYVALSRVTHPRNVVLRLTPERAQTRLTTNIVFDEIFKQ